jgi:hypothetical protein
MAMTALVVLVISHRNALNSCSLLVSVGGLGGGLNREEDLTPS